MLHFGGIQQLVLSRIPYTLAVLMGAAYLPLIWGAGYMPKIHLRQARKNLKWKGIVDNVAVWNLFVFTLVGWDYVYYVLLNF